MPVEDRTEVLRVEIQAENIIILGGVHHLGKLGVGELGESLPGCLELLSTNVQLDPVSGCGVISVSRSESRTCDISLLTDLLGEVC